MVIGPSAPAAILVPMILEGLNPEQRAAAEAVRGPVCILAGAGSGKTTTLTRRIAHGISSGAFDASGVLALTFTDRAAKELRERLRLLGIAGDVRARTFHAEALAQVAHFAGSPTIVGSKASIIGPIVRRLPKPYNFRATKDVAGEIERAKNRRVTPLSYVADLGSHVPVLPPDLMVSVFREYEKRKRGIDFEDLLEHAIRLMKDRPDVAEKVRAKYQTFSVDEYQDVNLLQQTLLDAWLGGRDEICVVGDDYQSIYGFTGATPSYLIDFAQRYPGARVVTLTSNYRSTPQVLHVANRLTSGLGGRSKVLQATREEGGACELAEYASDEEETRAIVTEIDRLASSGVPFEEMAILYRINARSEDYEEALAAARIPYQVRDGAFLRRPGPRAALRILERGVKGKTVEHVCRDLGWDPNASPEGAEEITRHADLSRLVALSEEFDGSIVEFVADLRKRFEDDASARGVVLSTYHRAKGLEWDAVFLPRLEERELPFALSKQDEEVAEERRLLYVGITRARTHLRLSWARVREGRTTKPSRFLREINPSQRVNAPASAKPAREPDSELFSKLRAWRKRTAEEMEVPPYVVFHDKTLREICDRGPQTLAELSEVSGVGPAKLDRHGDEVLAVLRGSGD